MIQSLMNYCAQADSLIDLARALGEVCLREARLIRIAEAEPGVDAHVARLRGLIASIEAQQWSAPRSAGGFRHLLDAEARALVERMEPYRPLDCLAALRGLCEHALPDFYKRVRGRVPIHLGTPLPVASRPIHELFVDRRLTPRPERALLSAPLRHPGYYCFQSLVSDPAVVLDFTYRARIDRLGLVEGVRRARTVCRLPRIATLHLPLGEGECTVKVQGDGRFFDVAPAKWDVESVLARLRDLADAEIAVLPELSLPAPDALEQAIASEPDRYPPLIVAGSAHVRSMEGGREIRANVSNVYLEGERVGTHRKISPLQTGRLGGRRFSPSLVEDLTGEPKEIVVLSGERTRLGVAICADVNESAICTLLRDAGVNLLLVPAFTYSLGAFNSIVADLAGHCQGVCVVANADLETGASDGQPTDQRPAGEPAPGEPATDGPFHVLAGAPFAAPAEQSQTYRYRGARRPPCGVLDPNLPLAGGAMSWR